MIYRGGREVKGGVECTRRLAWVLAMRAARADFEIVGEQRAGTVRELEDAGRSGRVPQQADSAAPERVE